MLPVLAILNKVAINIHVQVLMNICFMDHIVIAWGILKLPNFLPKWLYHFAFSLANRCEFLLLHILTNIWCCRVLHFSHSYRHVVASLCLIIVAFIAIYFLNTSMEKMYNNLLTRKNSKFWCERPSHSHMLGTTK